MSAPTRECREPLSAVSDESAAIHRSTLEVRAPAAEEEGSRSRVLRWLKAAGEPVSRDEPLLEIETDKVTVEIAAPASGVLTEIVKPEQEEIAPGELLARIGADDEPATAVAAASSSTAGAPSTTPRASGQSRGAHSPLSPAVRRLLGELDIDPTVVSGTGAGGRVTVDDVLRHAEERRSALGAGETVAMRRVPHSATRRRIAEHMVRSLLRTAPHVTTVFEADYSAVLAHRDRHREALAARGVPLTLTAYVLEACVGAIRAVPEANARWTESALEILEPIHIGVGTAVEDKGLIVPVVRDVPALSLAEIACELGRLVALAREDRLTPADVRGGTFTISNHGVSGSLIAAPIVIHQPQVAILGVGKVEKRPVVVEEAGEERIAARPRGYLTLTIDHRVMDGHRANHFLGVLVRRLESWRAE